MSNIVENFIEMVKIDSESSSVKRFTEYLENIFGELGGKVYKDEKSIKYTKTDAPNLIIHFKGNTNSSPVGLSAHVDTVVPGKGIEPVIKDGVISTTGDTILGSDDKSGIAAIYTALKNIIEKKQDMRECYVILTVSEEIGLLGAKYLDTDLIKGLENIIVFDAGGPFGEVVVSAPSQNSIFAVVKGKAAHAGVEPEKGINAIFAASCGISKLELGRIDEETTCNIGIINGGKATNIVPDKVILEGEVRSRDDSKLEKVTQNMVSTLKREVEKAGASITIDVVNEYKSYNIDENDPLIEDIRKSVEKTGIKMRTGSTGGGSDTNIHNAKGLKAVNMSTGMDKVHTTDENIRVEDLERLTVFIEEFLKG